MTGHFGTEPIQQGVIMANMVKARETIQVIRENPSRLDMRMWVFGAVNPNAAHWSECGTAFCFFGWRCVLDGLRPSSDPTDRMFGRFIRPDGETVKALDHGMASLELTKGEAEAIAFREGIADIAALEWVVEAVISGDWAYCESCHGDGDEGCGDCHYRGIVRPSERT